MVPSLPSSHLKELYIPKDFFVHAALLDQGFPHCPIFPTAASRRSRTRFSVSSCLITLSRQIAVVGLVSCYLTNYLMARRPLHRHPKAFLFRAYAVLATVSSRYPPPMGRFLRVTHSFATFQNEFPSEDKFPSLLVRLACVRHAASVHPEPGSNPPSNFM